MVLNLAPRGAGAFRPLHLAKVLSRPRVAFIHSHARRISPATNGLLSNPATNGIFPVGVRAGSLINSYATTTAGRGRPKAGAQKKTTKSTETDKKAAPKKKAAKKTASKPKSKAKAKPKPKPKPKRKVLTEKQKEAKKAKEFREKVKELKATALESPKRLPEQPWTVTFQGVYPEAAKNNEKGVPSFRAAVELAKSISPEQKERYVATAHANKASNIAAYDEWLKRHTPLQIKEANHARRRLAQLGKASLPQLHDSRLVKRPRTAYLLYFTERFEHGDFKHMGAKDMIIRVAEEWKGLTDAEKVKYQKLQASDLDRYKKEYKQTYGQEV